MVDVRVPDDGAESVVTVGDRADLLTGHLVLADLAWSAAPVEGPVTVQCSAHGPALAASVVGDTLRWDQPQRRVAPGQSEVLYAGDVVLGGGTAT